MSPSENPAMQAFVTQLVSELVLAQVFIRRRATSFDLRHIDDLEVSESALRSVSIAEIRTLAQFTEARAFRPLRSSPTLARGWRFHAENEQDLERALNEIYPAAIADWFAAQAAPPPVTDYREFTARQTGMYRITTMLDDAQAACVAQACCHKRFCLKRRLWTVPGLAIDIPELKSLIPCLEPCAVLLEFARKAMRMEQEEKMSIEVSTDDIATLKIALNIALRHPDADVREGDLSSPANPRRLQLALEKLQASVQTGVLSGKDYL